MGAFAALALAASTPTAFQLTSPAFQDGGELPAEYSCQGTAGSPELNWTAPPEGTKSFALLLQDIDARKGKEPAFWVVYGIPGAARSLPKRYKWLSKEKDGTLQGTNSLKREGYSGPCPPPHRERRYAFTLYALDSTLEPKLGLTEADLARAIEGHILGQTRLTVSYRRL